MKSRVREILKHGSVEGLHAVNYGVHSTHQDLFKTIRNFHNTDPWQALCRCCDPHELYGSALSEYEIYFNFAFAKTNQVKMRNLTRTEFKYNAYLLDLYRQEHYHYVSCHTWM